MSLCLIYLNYCCGSTPTKMNDFDNGQYFSSVVPTKTIRIYPNQKPWINSNVRSALSARTSAFKSGNTDDRKQASYDLRRSIKAAKRQYKNKVEEHFNNNNPRSMWQGINNITGFKGNKPATRVEPDTRLKRVSGTDKALLPSTSIIRVIRVKICARIK